MELNPFPIMKSIVSRLFSTNRKLEIHQNKKELKQNKKKIKNLETKLTAAKIDLQKACADFSLYANERRRFDRGQSGTAASFIQGHPLVSIIIINRNGLDHFRVLLKSLVERTFYRNFEIICVDNGSTDESIAFLEGYRKYFPIKIILNGENKSFSEANNIGVREAEGDYYLFLNNDIEVTDGWLDELLHACQQEENAGAVGARLLYPEIPGNLKKAGRSYAIQHAGVIFKEVVREDQYFIQPYNRRNCEPDRDHFGGNERLAAVTAAVLLVEAGKYKQIGGFDEQYIYGYEDVDLCLKLDEAGYRNIYCPHSILFHYEFGTQKEDDKEEVYQRRLRNFQIFRKRWQDYLSKKVLEDKLQGTHIYTDQHLLVTLLSQEPVSGTEAADESPTDSDLTACLRRVFKRNAGPEEERTASCMETEGADPYAVPDYVLTRRTYQEYEALADGDMETDLLIDPAGKYKDLPHRKESRQVISSWI